MPENPAASDIMFRLRAAVRDTHDRIERLPFPAAIMAGRLTRNEYVSAMQRLLAVHESLEAELDRHIELRCVYEPHTMARKRVLRRDLAALGCADPQTEGPGVDTLAARFRCWSAEQPESPWPLLGALYVLEGSRMGSLVMARPLAQSLGLPMKPGCGLDYHLDGRADRPAAWASFGEAMRAAPLPPAGADAIVSAAVGTMDGLYQVYAAFDVRRNREAV